MKFYAAALTLALAVSAAPGPQTAAAQQAPTTGEHPATVRVFLDCHAYCDFDFIRRSIPYVSWVRDRTDSQVHVMVTDQSTGSGGRQITLQFIGQGPFAGAHFELIENTDANDVREEIREQVTRTLSLGLVRFAAASDAADGLRVAWEAPDGTSAAEPRVAETDPWNAWVFTLNGNGNLSGESQRSHRGAGGRFTADRTTADWKLSFNLGGNWDRTELVYYQTVSDTQIDTTTVLDERHSYRSNALVVRALADHWSAGTRASASAASRLNQDFTFTFGPALEYSIFPYEESDRRQLRVVYSPGVRYVDYEEVTLFGKLHETLIGHQATIAYDATQPWGSARISLDGSQYFHDISKFSVRLGGHTNFRIFRGLNFNVGGSIDWIRDQLYLPRQGDSIEDVLLQRRQLATDYQYRMRFGLSYRFGSALNNIVNPRLDNHGRFF
ncbi:MAG: hypothetical protein R6U63_01810 [Longimicrobiales bacterium]